MALENSFDYSVTAGGSMTRGDWVELSSLFSAEYGRYSDAAPARAGERIRLGVGYYERAYAGSGYQVARCRENGRLVAEAIYLERMTSRGRVAFVVQLVVAAEFRNRGIASTLLHAIWGFSDYYCWGIVTSNAFTVEALERAVFRKARPEAVASELEFLRTEVLSGVSFLSGCGIRTGTGTSVVESGFYTDRSGNHGAADEVSRRLGELAEGEEWLAFAFRWQEPDDLAAYREMVAASSGFVRDAYRRMPQAEQPWSSATEDEIDVILSSLPGLSAESRIADFGAGSGRHVRALRSRGFRHVTGIDFAVGGCDDVLCADCRSWRSREPLDLALCLYDVVGSFPEDADNEAIVANVAANLRVGGYAVVSVSNWDYLDRAACVTDDFDDADTAVKALFRLKPSRAMAGNGELFDVNAVLVDEKRRLVCHKEQFPAGCAALPGEYPIRDRRFTADEITGWLEKAGLSVLSSRFVRAGFKVDYAVSTGKEILVFARKGKV